MTRVAVLDDWQDAARSRADWPRLQARAEVTFFPAPFADEDAAAAALADYEIILATRERTPFPVSLVDRLPKLRMFGLTGNRAGLIALAEMVERGIVVCTTGGGPGVESTAELALALLLAAARRLPQADASVRAGHFQQGVPIGHVLAGKTLGLVGLGRIGARMCGYGKALGMRVVAWSPNLDDARAAAAGVERRAKDDLMAVSDAVSLHLVLSPRSRGILGAADLARMKPGAILVNTARAPLVDEAALLAAVASGRLVAALDVFHKEPLPADYPLLRSPNCILSPHLGYSAAEVYDVFYPQCVENALAFLDGTPIRLYEAPGP